MTVILQSMDRREPIQREKQTNEIKLKQKLSQLFQILAI